MLALSTNFINAQDAKSKKQQDKAATIEKYISDGSFEVVAEYVSPTGGSTIYLTSRYDMSVGKDSLQTFLPYFGRAYMAPVNPSQGGIQFTSTDFTYNVEERKKNGWDITILPKDTRDVRQLYLSVFEDGRATLQVISNNRQAISYSGHIRERKRR